MAAQLTHTMSKRKTYIGTPHWMAPEVIAESSYDGKVRLTSHSQCVKPSMAECMQLLLGTLRPGPPETAQGLVTASCACVASHSRRSTSGEILLAAARERQIASKSAADRIA